MRLMGIYLYLSQPLVNLSRWSLWAAQSRQSAGIAVASRRAAAISDRVWMIHLALTQGNVGLLQVYVVYSAENTPENKTTKKC